MAAILSRLFVGFALSVGLAVGAAMGAAGGRYNLKVVTDASPDYSDLPAMIRSITENWATAEEKCWALFYWNHQARRQTSPMMLHGLALTDPIRQFNDYGYTMCSTIAGINCGIWDALGLPTRYWDITAHTVSEVHYGGRWHMYDNSMSALYTLCDGVTLAGVEEIGRAGACAASGGVEEPGHIARHHCLMATSPRGFLTGADTIRSLDEEYRCFNPGGLKERTYYRDWDRGHRYILNLRANESYTRHYHSLGDSPEFYVPNQGRDPEAVNRRYRIRGNGLWTFAPTLTARALPGEVCWSSNVTVLDGGGVAPDEAGVPAEVVFKLSGANVITSLKVHARFRRQTAADATGIAVSVVNGLGWRTVWENERVGETSAEVELVDEVNGAYEVLVKVSLRGDAGAADAQLLGIRFETVTMLNSKTQPRLAFGRNTVFVGTGAATDSIVLWPDLQGSNAAPYLVDQRNVATQSRHPGYQGVLHAARGGEEAYAVFRIDGPQEVTRIEYGGRFYNRAPGSRIDLLHSFDAGASWTRTWSLTNTAQPWDVLQSVTVDRIPPATRSVLFKYRLESPTAGPAACSLYGVRLEAQHRAPAVEMEGGPVEVTFRWGERQADYSLIERSHTEVIRTLPQRYTVNVGGADHPVMQSLRLQIPGTHLAALAPGYADGRDVGGSKHAARWVTAGKNLALGKPYTVSVPSTTQWEAGDPAGTKLTEGIVGPPYPGGVAPRSALCWNRGQSPEITVDLGRMERCGAFRIQLGAGWPWWDALKGEFEDRVEVLTSLEGERFASHGCFDLDLRWKDLPVNHFWPDEEVIAAHLFDHVLPVPVECRWVRFRITPARALTVSEVQVLDEIRSEPFDLRLALP